MNSSNPFMKMMNTMGQNMPTPMNMPVPMSNGINPIAQMMLMMQNRNQSTKQTIPINQAQFKQYLPNIDDNMLQQLALRAKEQGISNEDIQSGLNFIKQLK